MSLRKAINEMCKQCIYDKHQNGTWRQQVEDCTAHGCSLFPVRPVTQETILERREEKKAQAA